MRVHLRDSDPRGRTCPRAARLPLHGASPLHCPGVLGSSWTHACSQAASCSPRLLDFVHNWLMCNRINLVGGALCQLLALLPPLPTEGSSRQPGSEGAPRSRPPRRQAGTSRREAERPQVPLGPESVTRTVRGQVPKLCRTTCRKDGAGPQGLLPTRWPTGAAWLQALTWSPLAGRAVGRLVSVHGCEGVSSATTPVPQHTRPFSFSGGAPVTWPPSPPSPLPAGGGPVLSFLFHSHFLTNPHLRVFCIDF